ncbi:MAG: helix-turn-helix domain-containing protein [Candidatus Omnitrophica bacterium]|nr:helix-turn-helix domain-containing protein [Candidatus Omnitrophota bacterium]MDD5774935.1 helix-turn-helix domain-containing protein [Candidatus Omnitrophota bacterium]
MMAKVRLEKTEAHFRELLKNKGFKREYELERAKVALAQRIAEIRQENHLNQKDMAKRLNVSQQFISQIETAQEDNLTLDTLIRLAKCLGRGVKISFPKVAAGKTCLIVG